MTSVAAFLATLAGAAPKEGQTATPANAAGAVGLFASLLGTAQASVSAQGEAAPGAGTAGGKLGLSLQLGPATEGDPAAVEPDAALGEALSDGLGLSPGEVEAAAVEGPAAGQTDTAGTGDATPAVAAGASVAVTAELDVSAPEGHANAADPSPAPSDAAEPAALAPTVETNVAAAVETATGAHAQPAAPAASQPQAEAAPAEKTSNPTGLENALNRASDQGGQNSLQRALGQAPQARGAGDAPQQGQGQVKAEAAADSPRPTAQPSAGVDAASDRSAQGRPEFAPLEIRTAQRVIDAGNGKTQIQIHRHAGGETPGLSGPPTLTVNMQASAASPGAVSPNTPHVPVSALAVHIAQQANNGARRFDIRLDPPELGRIEVRLDFSREGHVTTHLVVERAETLDLLQRDARQLERALQDAGLDTSEQGMKFSLKDQGLAKGGDEKYGPDQNPGSKEGAEESGQTAADGDDPMPPPARYSASAGLDIRI